MEALMFWERQFRPTSAIKVAGPDLIVMKGVASAVADLRRKCK